MSEYAETFNSAYTDMLENIENTFEEKLEKACLDRLEQEELPHEAD
jgi:hypothetical protein